MLRHVLINGWYAGASGAGSGQYVDHLLRSLPLAAPDVRWSLLLPADMAAPEFTGVQVVRRELPPLPRQLQKLWWEQITVPNAARTIGADVLWTPYWAAPLWQPVATVVTVHDLIPLLLPENRGGFLQRQYTNLVAYTAKRSAQIIAVSEAGKRDIVAHLGVPAERVHVVHHGPNQPHASLDVISPESVNASRVRTKYGLPERYFLYLGGFEARKNIQGIVSGYVRYLEKGGDAAVKLVIAGKLPSVDSAFTPDPRRMARELGIVEQVIFPGFIDEADKRAIYNGAVGFLFPSKYEGFGMMVLEAMQAGAPVITSSTA